MIGFMAGAGIVVRKALPSFWFDFIDQRLAEGMPLAEAVVDASPVRFRSDALNLACRHPAGASVISSPTRFFYATSPIAFMAGEIASLLISRMAVPVLYFMANKPRPARLAG